MTFDEALFWVAVTVLGTGLYFVIDASRKGTKKKIGWLTTVIGAGLTGYLVYAHHNPPQLASPPEQSSLPAQVQQESHGANSPNIVGNGNRVTINANTPAVLPQPTFREKADSIYFSLGEHGVTDIQTMEHLRKQPAKPFLFNGYAPVVLRAKGNVLLYDVTIWGGDGKPPIEVKNNQFTVLVPDWDWNSNPNAFEVVNESGVPVFQMIRKNPNHFVVNGVFPLPGGNVIAAGPDGMGGPYSSVPPNFALKPIFKYPSWKFAGQYAE